MIFGEVALDDAVGAILAHSVRLPGCTVRKGTVLKRADIKRLREAGVEAVTAARLARSDLDENAAARKIASALVSRGTKLSRRGNTGRANLIANAPGIVVIEEERIHRINAVDEAITLATVRPFEPVAKDSVIATVKVITFAVPEGRANTCIRIAERGGPPIRLAPFGRKKIGFVQTLLPGLKDSIVAKASETMASRFAEMGLKIAREVHCPHDETSVRDALQELAGRGCDIAMVLGASAVVDRRDVVPQAVVDAGGEIEHLGLPVDPGHLMLMARLGDMRILGIPGSARSPRLHGFDWVLQRLVADIDVGPDDLIRMGVGGLLKEIPGRPVPREQDKVEMNDRSAKIGGIVLAAGRSRRMGRINKLLAEIDGAPMVVHAVKAMLASKAGPVVVVLGHEPDQVKDALAGLDVSFVRNPDYAGGLSTSLRAGIEALPASVDGAVVALGDMPRVRPADIDALIAAFEPAAGASICLPTFDGKRGNPVLWGRRHFADMSSVAGDVGARHLIGENSDQVIEVPRDNPGILLDLDTPEALAEHRRASGTPEKKKSRRST